MIHVKPGREVALEPISGGEMIVLDGLSGERTIWDDGNKVFQHISPTFPLWMRNGVGERNGQAIPTNRVPILRLRVKGVGDYRPELSSLAPSIDDLCLTQDEIIEICDKHGRRLDTNSGTPGTIFLCKEGEDMYLLHVYDPRGWCPEDKRFRIDPYYFHDPKIRGALWEGVPGGDYTLIVVRDPSPLLQV